MATEGPDGVKTWRHSFAAPLTVSITALEQMAAENGARIIGPDSAGYKYIIVGSDEGFYDVYRAPDVDWSKVPAEFYDVASPAAATDWNVTVPTGERWLLLGVHMTYVADANVANRVVKIVTKSSSTGNAHWLRVFGSVTAGQTAVLIAHTGVLAEDTSGAEQIVCVPTDMDLPAGSYIYSSTADKQAADDFTVIQLHVKRAHA